ncbi:MAG: hypothetical protein FWC41_01915 [Firmicutes bacterium]|nr:hypothetical protein [Bacillota bacterium]
MLQIRVNNQFIYINKDTSIQMEVNNSIFSVDEIIGKIIYTFDVPAHHNDKIFGFARFIYVQKKKKYEAEILVGGIQIAKGDLYIQKATKTTYSLGVVVNPIPEGWGEKKLNENDLGEIIISRNETEHKEKWLEFLQNSLTPDATIKFPLFINENFYGGENADFGFFEGKQASIYPDSDTPTPALEKFYVNRLFFEQNKNIVKKLDSCRGIRIFNEYTAYSDNSFAFAPAINLLWLLKKIINNWGYSLIGSFYREEKIKKIFFQSLRALDENTGSFSATIVHINPSVQYHNNPYAEDYLCLEFEVDNKRWDYFVPTTSREYNINVRIKTHLPDNILSTFSVSGEHLEGDEALMFFLLDYSEGLGLPNMINDHIIWQGNVGYQSGGNWEFFNSFYKIYNLQQLKDEIRYNGDGFYSFHFAFNQHLVAGHSYYFYFNKLTLIKETYIRFASITKYSKIITSDHEIENHVLNIFSKKMVYNEYLPNFLNGGFIKTILSTFGLSFYIDQQQKTIELSFVKDVFSTSYIQLDKYLLPENTYISEVEETKIEYRLPPVNNSEIDPTRLINEVYEIRELPDAKNSFGKIAFVKDQNKFVESIREGDPTKNWIYLYSKYSGNNKSFTVGEGSPSELTPEVLIPNMKNIDSNIGATDVILEIDKAGVSPFISTDTTELSLILINYTGPQKLSKTIGGKRYHYEGAQLISETGNEYDLTATGENSIGKTFIEPWLKLLANHKTVTHYFIFDLKTFLEVLTLLKPQDKPVEQQMRWVMVESVKLLPKKMTFQFTEGQPYILAEIEFAKPRVEI